MVRKIKEMQQIQLDCIYEELNNSLQKIFSILKRQNVKGSTYDWFKKK